MRFTKVERLYFRLFRGAHFFGNDSLTNKDKGRGVLRRERWDIPIEGKPFGINRSIVEREVFLGTKFGRGLKRAIYRR